MTKIHRPTFLKALVCAAIFFAVLGYHASFWWPFYSDDALISLRYSARLLAGKGLTWNDGLPRIEGYSNFLWTVLAALFGLFRINLILATRIMGFACMAVVMFTVARWQLERREFRESIIPLGIGLLFFALATPIAVWALGGLEQPLIAALVALSLPLIFRLIDTEVSSEATGDSNGISQASRPSIAQTTLLLSLILGLNCLTRPDGPLFAVGAFFGIVLGRLSLRRPLLPPRHLFVSLPFFPLLLYGGQLAFRLWYYGEWVPNTALVKIDPTPKHLMGGLHYVLNGLHSLQPFSAFALVLLFALLFSPKRRGRAIALFSMLLCWLPYLIYIGGGIHPAYRHFVAVVVVLTFALVDGLDHLMEWIDAPPGTDPVSIPRRLARMGIPILLLASFYPYVLGETTDHENLRVYDEKWVRNGEVTGRLLHRAFADRLPTVAVTAAGCIPFWSELPALDMLGLNDYYLPRHPPSDFGQGYIGHELGNGRYVLDQRPDIICFHTGIRKGIFRSGDEMQKTVEFYERYLPVRVLGRDPRDFVATLWMQKESPKVGIEHVETEIRIPGYLFQNDDLPPATLDTESDRIVQPLMPGQSASLEIDEALDAEWTVEVRATGSAAIRSSLRAGVKGLRIDLHVEGHQPAALEQVVLRHK